MKNNKVAPITLDGNGLEKPATLQSIQRYIENGYALHAQSDRAIQHNTKELVKMDAALSSFDERLTEMQQSNVAKKVIRDQLQMERHRKAKQFVHENVQLSIEEIIGTKEEIEKKLAERMKRETTQVMCLITSYVKKQLHLRSIDDLPNCFVEKHKQLLKELTWKNLDIFLRKAVVRMGEESTFSLCMVSLFFVGLAGFVYVMDWVDKRWMKDVEE
ncbi:hypothetical protein [Bacillus thuringiensis]|uniref:hypothetical protein n=1 Tax=Bacillus thuringiensis TaxID=1428 RepID=UPI0011A2F510|nr:hypothetical protein [Bacillus thuringiensis]